MSNVPNTERAVPAVGDSRPPEDGASRSTSEGRSLEKTRKQRAAALADLHAQIRAGVRIPVTGSVWGLHRQ